MASRVLGLSLLLLNVVLHMSGTAESAVAKPNPTEFIKSSCEATRYPVACVQSLLGVTSAVHQSDEQLAVTALSVSVSKTRSSASFVKKLGAAKGMKPVDYNVVRDCIENLDDSVDGLSQSVREFGLLGKPKSKSFAWHMSNIQTWVSAAITDQDTCLDGFDGLRVDPKLKAAIRPSVVGASQVTSNALALINRFASKNRIY